MEKRPQSSAGSALASNKRKREVSDNVGAWDGMTKSELLEALKITNANSSAPFKDKNEIIKRLNKFPAVSKADQLDSQLEAADLIMKDYKPKAQAFVCYRCDKAKISTMKGRWKNDKLLCTCCFDHITRCVIPYRNVPEYQRPERCVHQVPKAYQKQYR